MLKARLISETSISAKLVEGGVTIVLADAETYKGSYEVTPKAGPQTLPTAEKYMEEDVRVKGIPYYETSNAAGGNTLYIASEVD